LCSKNCFVKGGLNVDLPHLKSSHWAARMAAMNNSIHLNTNPALQDAPLAFQRGLIPSNHYSIHDFDSRSFEDRSENVEKLAAKIHSLLSPHGHSPHEKPCLENFVAWMLDYWLVNLDAIAGRHACSDSELTTVSPVAIPPICDQSRRFISLFDAGIWVNDELSLFDWFTKSKNISEISISDGESGIFAVHLNCGCLSNGGGAIIAFMRSRGLRLRAVVKDGAIYQAWFDEPEVREEDLFRELKFMGINPITLDLMTAFGSVPGVNDAKLIYLDA
jgi:hypothetical protein